MSARPQARSTEAQATAALQSTAQVEIAVEMLVVPEAPIRIVDDSIDAALKWLESSDLTDEDKQAIASGIDNGVHRLTAFGYMMSMVRARRLVTTQRWLGELQDRLMSDEVRNRMNTDPYLTLSIARLMRDIQEDDTKYLEALTKASAADTLVAAQQAAQKKKESEAVDSVTAELLKMAPHKRERLRKMIEALKQ